MNYCSMAIDTMVSGCMIHKCKKCVCALSMTTTNMQCVLVVVLRVDNDLLMIIQYFWPQPSTLESTTGLCRPQHLPQLQILQSSTKYACSCTVMLTW